MPSYVSSTLYLFRAKIYCLVDIISESMIRSLNPILEPVQNLRTLSDNSGMRKSYPSDISRDQFEQIRELLESARKKTRPRQVDLYDVFCAVLYLLKSGCQWRMLPSDFPKWRTVHHYFSLWSEKPEERGGESLFLRKIFGCPTQKSAKTTRPLCLRLPQPSWSLVRYPTRG